MAADLVDLSSAGARVFIDQRFDPIFGIGEPLYLHLVSRSRQEPFVAAAVVRDRTEVEGGRAYAFVFVDPLGLSNDVPPEMAKLLNHRADFRVEPDPSQPIEITVSVDGKTMEKKGRIRNISTAGMSFTADLSLESDLTKIRHIHVAFELPDTIETILMHARIRHRYLKAAGICYGVFFLVDEKTAHHQQAISAFVSSRQRALPVASPQT